MHFAAAKQPNKYSEWRFTVLSIVLWTANFSFSELKFRVLVAGLDLNGGCTFVLCAAWISQSILVGIFQLCKVNLGWQTFLRYN
jgi:hypothetical protein